MAKIRNALKILERVTGDNASIQAGIARARVNFHVAQMIYDARTNAGLTQAQLAEMIGTRQSVIARLEDADYQGHSLSMLQRIAAVLKQRLEVRFVAQRAKPVSPSRRLKRG